VSIRWYLGGPTLGIWVDDSLTRTQILVMGLGMVGLVR
jgi:hypothetical protein